VTGGPTRRTVVGAAGAAGLGITSLTLPGAWAAASTLRTLGLEASPATSAAALLADGWTTDGWYWIRTSGMAAARRVWCDLTDEGGGWMLVAYSPDLGASGARGLRYPNAWEGGEGTLDRMAVATMDLWSHLGTPQCGEVMKMASTTAGRQPRLADMEIANRVTYENPGDLDLAPYATASYTARVAATKLSGTWRPVKGHTVMTGPLEVDAPFDWIQTSDGAWTTCGPSSQLTSDGRSGNGRGTGSWTYPSSADVFGVADVGPSDVSKRTDVRSYAVLIR
jgi:hypothetical protein